MNRDHQSIILVTTKSYFLVTLLLILCVYCFHYSEECLGTVDCDGVCNGDAEEDCAGQCKGNAEYDCAGECSGNNAI